MFTLTSVNWRYPRNLHCLGVNFDQFTLTGETLINFASESEDSSKGQQIYTEILHRKRLCAFLFNRPLVCRRKKAYGNASELAKVDMEMRSEVMPWTLQDRAGSFANSVGTLETVIGALCAHAWHVSNVLSNASGSLSFGRSSKVSLFVPFCEYFVKLCSNGFVGIMFIVHSIYPRCGINCSPIKADSPGKLPFELILMR